MGFRSGCPLKADPTQETNDGLSPPQLACDRSRIYGFTRG